MLKLISRYFENAIEAVAWVLVIVGAMSGFGAGGVLGAVIGLLIGFVINIIVFGILVQIIDIKRQLQTLNENFSKMLNKE